VYASLLYKNSRWTKDKSRILTIMITVDNDHKICHKCVCRGGRGGGREEGKRKIENEIQTRTSNELKLLILLTTQIINHQLP
jgi:hypothetical protein